MSMFAPSAAVEEVSGARRDPLCGRPRMIDRAGARLDKPRGLVTCHTSLLTPPSGGATVIGAQTLSGGRWVVCSPTFRNPDTEPDASRGADS